jgi:AcrR family transcriptional regulator
VSGKTRDKIIKVALTLFANDGYDATSMEKIATGVGIKKSSIYTFIASKEALFWEIYEDIEKSYHNYMVQLLTDSASMSPHERLYYLFKNYLLGNQNTSREDDVVERTFWIRIMFFPPTVIKDRLLSRALQHEMELGDKYQEIIREGIQQGVLREAPPEEILLSYYSLRQGLYALMNVYMSDMPQDQKIVQIDKVWDNYWHGIKVR